MCIRDRYDSFWGEFEEQISAKDNYYNHYLYQGWQHWGMGIGLSLIHIFYKPHRPAKQSPLSDIFYKLRFRLMREHFLY